MKRKNKEKLKELLIKISEITRDEDTELDIRVDKDYLTVNNNYWEVRGEKRLSFFSFDGGKKWTDLV